MPNFQNAKIYSIRSHKTDEIYTMIGSTTQTLAQRIGKHRTNYRMWLRDPTRSKITAFQMYNMAMLI